MTEYEKQAFALHDKGHNCAQSVALPFCEQFGVDTQTAMRALEGFGAGMGGREQACGALSGAVFIAGLKYSDGNVEAPASKKQTYAVSQALCEAFVKACGSAQCAAIKGAMTGKPLKSCAECIALGVRLVSDMLNEEE